MFWLQLGLICQVFGGGFSGRLMHVYEGWLISPLRNLLAPRAEAPAPAPPMPPGSRTMPTHWWRLPVLGCWLYDSCGSDS